MAEYNDVIKQFKRMCRYYNNRATQNDCPLYCKGHGCNISHCSLLAFEGKKFANVVMAWAAEHPEPVYPTWGDWFAERGDLIKLWRYIRVCSEHGQGVIGFLYTNIPADIAEKLGIEPKEGTC